MGGCAAAAANAPDDEDEDDEDEDDEDEDDDDATGKVEREPRLAFLPNCLDERRRA